MAEAFWSGTTQSLLERLSSGPAGLSATEAEKRLQEIGPNRLKPPDHRSGYLIFIRQFSSPITILLIGAAILSFFLGEQTDAFIILAIIFISALLGFYQEKGAANALDRLLSLVQITVQVLRDGQEISLSPENIVPGDLVLLNAGNTIPGDCRLLESKDLFTNEASLTGETFPVEKKCGDLPADARLADRGNVLFMGTHVISGKARAVVVHTGLQTEFGAISQHLRQMQPETEFEAGIRKFGYLLLEVTLLLIVVIFSINVFLHKPVLDSFLFSLAIAVGLTPQLLPAIISINLAKGASNMAKKKVIVKRLSAIENLGCMDVLCSDKTGTITTGEIKVFKTVNYRGDEDVAVFRLAYLNASMQNGFNNPIDQAILAYGKPDTSLVKKVDELPYDFIRKRLSILVSGPATRGLSEGGLTMITKGAFENTLSVCGQSLDPGGQLLPMGQAEAGWRKQYGELSQEGYRILGLAYKPIPASRTEIKAEDEKDMIFAGLLLLTDPPKENIEKTLANLKELGIALKIITGDNALVAEHVGKLVGLAEPVILTGDEIRDMGLDALSRVAGGVHIFAAVEPNHKEKILLALKKAGHVVGYMGDGINDAPALHVADTGVSVNGAADVAKDASDIVLLGNDLEVLVEGVKEGRKTFANTMKYIFMATSANFGNMFSMAGASLFLTFLPLLPKQVLLTNLMTDIPEMTIATDSVDPETIRKPRRLSLRFIRSFMIVFGIVSSVFDYITFGVLLYWLKASPEEFRTGWFVESVASASLIVLVIRTSQAFYRNRPGKWLLISTIGIVLLTLLLPMTPIAGSLGFVPLPPKFYAVLIGIILLYVITAEMAKRIFYRGFRSNKPR
jgi:Mg2+-importing ATPase